MFHVTQKFLRISLEDLRRDATLVHECLRSTRDGPPQLKNSECKIGSQEVKYKPASLTVTYPQGLRNTPDTRNSN